MGTRGNVEVVERLLEAARSGPAGDWAAAAPLLHPDVEIDMRGMPDGGVFRGHDAWRTFYRRWFGTWDDLEVRAERVMELDGERVVAFMRVRGRGKGSGIEMSLNALDVYTLRDGLIVRQEGYTDRAEGLAALGIEA